MPKPTQDLVQNLVIGHNLKLGGVQVGRVGTVPALCIRDEGRQSGLGFRHGPGLGHHCALGVDDLQAHALLLAHAIEQRAHIHPRPAVAGRGVDIDPAAAEIIQRKARGRGGDQLHMAVQPPVEGKVRPLGVDLVAVAVVAQHGQDVLPIHQGLGHIAPEGAVAAHVPGDKLAVDPDLPHQARCADLDIGPAAGQRLLRRPEAGHVPVRPPVKLRPVMAHPLRSRSGECSHSPTPLAAPPARRCSSLRNTSSPISL